MSKKCVKYSVFLCSNTSFMPLIINLILTLRPTYDTVPPVSVSATEKAIFYKWLFAMLCSRKSKCVQIHMRDSKIVFL